MNIALEDPIKLSVYTVRVVPLIMFMWTRVICLFFLTVIRTRISVLSRSERFILSPVFCDQADTKPAGQPQKMTKYLKFRI